MAGSFMEFFKDYLTAREQRKLLETQRKMVIDEKNHELTLKELDLEMKFVEQGKMKPEDNLDYLAMKQMDKSYKDEVVLAVFITPVAMSFVPSLQPHVQAGFELLSNSMPEWYMYLVSGMVIVIYGLRSMVRLFFTGKSKELLKGSN